MAGSILSLTAQAQRLMGVATSNWSSTNSLYLNPASIADSRHKFTIDLFSINGFAENDLGTFNKSGLFTKINDRQVLGVNDVFKFDNKATVNLMAPYAEVKGPGFMWNIDHKNSIALTTRIRGGNQFTDVSQTIYRTIFDPNYATNGNGNYTLGSGKFKWDAATWSEIGLSYGRVLVDKGRSFLSVGVTARYLGGIGYISVNGNTGGASYTAASDSLHLTNTSLNYSSNLLSSNTTISNNSSNGDLLNRFFGKKGGSGVGGDIGLSYEFRPDYEKYRYDMDGKEKLVDYGSPRYKLRLSAAITDIGAINFKTADNRQATLSGNGYVKGQEIYNNSTNYQDFRNYTRSHGFNVDTSSKSTMYHMPTALVIGADYKLSGDFYVNATYINNIADRTKIGNYYYNQLTVTPRYDTRLFSIGVPVTYAMQSQSVKMGIGARVAGFFMGSDDMLALFSNNQYGFNFYAGAFVPVNYRKPKDSDGDKVSNKKDLCPGVVGTWEFKGCPNPDTDKDGIFDSVDKCPLVAGPRTAQGCPDKDLDSVADASDRCPDVAGKVALGGCPDRDGDGIADIDDVCPDQAGKAIFKGCPDTDGDGIADNVDKCPLKAGPEAFGGCPDTDGDGVPDNIDKCPLKAGPASNNGCPEISVQVKKRLAFAATALEFETGKAVIKKKSYPLLDEIVAILNEYKDYYMTIEGHTDDVGSDAKNLILSRDRAASVKAYYVSKGISNDRLETDGFGESRPVASNKTAAGRAKNRRVEMDLKLRK
ncbi:MAG: OmpA/MotB domain protein [Flavipsychrobacter sp.]|nr:OmpA/MotB domain protein [Flavipsychrobacter sp.]